MEKKITTKSLYGSHESFKSHHSNAIKTNASNIAANTTDITSIQTALSTKQNELTNTTDVSINELSVGNTPITPGSEIVYPLQIRQPFSSSPNPQNGFGVGMKIRYPRGAASTDVVDMASIESYFKSDGNTQTPYTGMKFNGMDGGTIRPLFDCYHASPQGDGESTMEIGVGATGTIKVQNIELDEISLATTLNGKQDILSNANTSAGNVTLRTLNFPDVVASGNILLPGNTQLFSGNAPSGVQAKIQNGNLIDFISLENTLLKTCTLGASWKYQNAASYSVVNENNNKILEQIDPAGGSHNWYKAGDTSVVMAWQASNDRLYLTGDVLANKFLHRISGTVVRSYGFFRFQGSSNTINMNTTGGIDIPWSNVHVDGQTFVPVGTTQVKIVTTGYYEIGFNVYCTSTSERANPTIRIRVNGNDTAYLAWSYIRASTNHNENSWTLSPVLMSLTANDILTIQGRFTSQGHSGGCFLYSNSASSNKAYSTLMMKRVA